ncbi:hypothetical protein SEA_WEASELS2_54 [Rhodococcus phage Weasels2]|uniref:Uncharacterized protein n=1 Tax=Rhodococcus phage Weasels2 TaxID=1897437 RepID=A0A1I9SA38_9CAUD|nr:hypothetical protein FDH04_gp054 [Rhodococcus phage Weasels2]AOZ63644.1 hypothetical protein SEA_WEASELS2_54 [Rhodococcus phage Weasels2]
MRIDDLKTDLGKHLFLYSPLRKFETPPELTQEIAEAFCLREGLPVPLLSRDSSGIDIVELVLPADQDDDLTLYTKFNSSFKTHGMKPPLLSVIQDDTNSN